MGSSSDNTTTKNHSETLGETLSKVNPAVPFVSDGTQRTTSKPSNESIKDPFADVDKKKVEETLLKETKPMADTLAKANPTVPFVHGSSGPHTHNKDKTADHDAFANEDALKKNAEEKLYRTDKPMEETLRKANEWAP
eukprot:scaffold39121_cov122-Amphora_coffeaeformis.AAC.1